MSSNYILGIVVIGIVLVGVLLFTSRDEFPLPEGDPVPAEEARETENVPEENSRETEAQEENGDTEEENVINEEIMDTEPVTQGTGRTSTRTVSVTDGTRHSIPIGEILSGGPGKDGIPSIDNPKFVSASGASFLDDSSIGLGLVLEGEARFYPYSILVWHEIVNDSVGNTPALVTYCPLCATGVVFDPRVDGTAKEFGVSGRLWQSNLLMYDRTGNEDTESLWSQVLGEAVVGPATGTKLRVIPSDTVRFGDWKAKYPNTKVLSEDTGAFRDYTRDPYGDYYTNESVSFGASFRDTRLHPKAFVTGIEIGNQFKAYHIDALPVGETTDTFAGESLTITKDASDSVTIQRANGSEVEQIRGFWFSWLAVHEETELYQ